MQKNYRGRLFRFFAVNTHWLLRGLWTIATKIVDEFTLTKMKYLGNNFHEEVHKVIDPENLEEKYGGKLPNKEKDFFPPEY